MNIFDVKTVRGYFSARIRALPKGGRGEARKIASYLGVSTTLISQILSGDRFLTLEQGELLAEYFGLQTLEADYFLFLIQFERAGTARLREYWKRKLDKLKSESRNLINRIEPKRILTEEERAVFYSNPIFSAVRLYASTLEKGRSLEEVSTRFELSRAKATRIIGFLRDAGLIEEVGGRYKMGAQSTHLESGSPHLQKHHANWRLKAVQYADDLSEQELMFTSPASISREDFDRLREKMVLFIKDFLKEAQASPAEEVACFNLDWFWMRK